MLRGDDMNLFNRACMILAALAGLVLLAIGLVTLMETIDEGEPALLLLAAALFLAGWGSERSIIIAWNAPVGLSRITPPVAKRIADELIRMAEVWTDTKPHSEWGE